jgi:hypothetical protein
MHLMAMRYMALMQQVMRTFQQVHWMNTMGILLMVFIITMPMMVLVEDRMYWVDLLVMLVTI